MRQDTLELIGRYYTAFNAADWEAMLDCLSEDVVHDLNQSERQQGKAAFRAFLERMNTCYQERLEEVTVLSTEDGARAGAEYVVHGTYQATDAGLPEATGQRYVLPGGAFFEVSSGRITRVTNYYNLEHWLRQVAGESGQ